MNPLILLALYITFFGAIHSLMATMWVKKRVYHYLEPQQYRLIYTILSVVLTIPIPIIWGMGRHYSPLVFVVPHPYALISYLIVLSSAVLFVLAAMQTELFEFLGLNAIFMGRGSNPRLNTDGFYNVTRHPMYFFTIIIIWAFPVMKMIDLVGNGFITLYFVIGAWFEEQKMVEEFGQEYLEYQSKVSMFIPVKWFKKKFK